MLQHVISHARLMRESTECMEAALQSSDRNEQLVAMRVFESPTVWSQWESEHSSLMRQLANCGERHVQVAALKHATFRLLHAKALFQYLRANEVRGNHRARVIAHFRPGRGYHNAMVVEHNVYVKRACSYICANHLGSEVVEDPAFLDPIHRYEELYAEYFSLYCGTLAESYTSDGCEAALLPLLKQQLNEYRWAILDPRRAQPFLRREAKLRSPTGDTARLPALNGGGPRR